MPVATKLTMLQVAVSDMNKAKKLYADALGLKITIDYRQDDDNWWVSLVSEEGDVTITLTTYKGHMQPGTATLYFATADIQAAHDELASKGIEVSDVQDDLHGPGSGTKWFNFKDDDGSLIHIEQA